jgi:ADP-ribosylglycohydrolase
MKRAAEFDFDIIRDAVQKILTDEEQTWKQAFVAERTESERVRMIWQSDVPGSGAPNSSVIGAILSAYNMGYDVTEAERLIPKGLDAFFRNDDIDLAKITALVFCHLNMAQKIPFHQYWTFPTYNDFADVLKEVRFLDAIEIDDATRAERISAGWLGQIVGAALGTAVEGYCSDQIRSAFGDIRGYIRPPNTYNDDITYEIAFLEAFRDMGYDVTADAIAMQWVARIPVGWSAEGVALTNLRLGIFPPESASRANPYREWIGAQMRGAVCGLVALGDPLTAAKLAFTDGSISHCNNGILGEIFNAVLVSLAICHSDVRSLLKSAISHIPAKSEYFSVIDFAYETCCNNDSWESAWKLCEMRYKEYNWIHAYPNAAAEVVALYFCNGSFDECMHIIAMEGQDADCNAAQLGAVMGVMNGLSEISAKWTDPIGDKVESYMRGWENTTVSEISRLTTECVIRARKRC